MPASSNVLPDMDEPRLRTLGKQLNRSRKSSIIHHDKLKDTLGTLEKSLSKEQRSVNGKYFQMGLKLKKNLAQVRGTQKCLKLKREQSFWEDTEEYPYGVYDGEPLSSYRREIDNIIERKHPKKRRMRKVEQYLRNGRTRGGIIDNDEAIAQFDNIMSKPKDRHRDSPIFQNLLRRMHHSGFEGFSSPDSTIVSRASSNSPKLYSRLPHMKLEDMHIGSRASSPALTEKAESSRPSKSVSGKLSLPPITADKRAVDSRRTGRGNAANNAPTLGADFGNSKPPVYSKAANGTKFSIRRLSKIETSNKELDMPELSRLKARRATSYVK